MSAKVEVCPQCGEEIVDRYCDFCDSVTVDDPNALTEDDIIQDNL